MPSPADHSRIVAAADNGRCLDAIQLERLETSFRAWAEAPRREDHRRSRRRILVIFLLIRYTGARLSEVLHLDPATDFDPRRLSLRFCKGDSGREDTCREVQIPAALAQELQRVFGGDAAEGPGGRLLEVDPGHVRRKFYEQARACGLPHEMGAPEVIRRSRAVELMQRNMPLPVVQQILGQSSPNLTAAFVAFSGEEMRQVARHFAARENRQRTSARNSFFGKIEMIRRGDVQAAVTVRCLSGLEVAAVITNTSLERQGLTPGALVAAEVKAPWVVICKGERRPEASLENWFQGTVHQVLRGRISSEVVVALPEGTELCAVITEDRRRQLGLGAKDTIWAGFNAFAVILQVD
jgi:molybdate transport system regulatory protein